MFYFGIVEDRSDPLKLGRCKVRIVGLHSPKKTDIPTDDLPWAYPIQPIISAGISGVGYAPVGLVEGSWVCVTFRDESKQIPIILGSVGGIPTDGKESVEYKTTNEMTSITPPKMIDSYSADVIGRIKSLETFKSKAVFLDTEDQDVKNYVSAEANESEEYAELINDTTGYYVGGYKNRALNGFPLKEDQQITQADSETQLKKEADLFLTVIKSLVRAPITQSMMDALVIFVHGIGINRFRRSKVLSELNSGNYEQAAVNLLEEYDTDKDKKRRAIEKTLFLKDPLPGQEQQQGQKITVEQSAIGDNAFNQPTGKYPLYKNEPDTNKLARHEDVGNTIVAFKESARVTGIAQANGTGAWDQPNVPYNADYPFNKVFASETGHVLEFDDTPSSERVHLYHRKGTFVEMDCNGSQINRIVGDSFEILERNGHVYVRGAMHVNVEGAKTLKVGGTLDVEVSGATNVNIHNDTIVNISGKADIAVLGEAKIKCAEALKIESKSLDIKTQEAIKISSGTTLDIKSANDAKISSGANMNIKGATNANVEGGSAINLKGAKAALEGSSSLDLNTGGKLSAGYATGGLGAGAGSAGAAAEAGDAAETGLANPTAKESPSTAEFSPLEVPTRSFREATVFESPDEGDSTQFVNKRIETGSLPKEEAKKVSREDIKETTDTLPRNNIQPPVSSCDIIFGMKDIPKNLQLSQKFNLLELTQNGNRALVNQVGLTKQQIACNLKGLSENCLDPIKEMYPNIIISSGFRRPGDVPGSSARSQHYNGEAADLVFKGFSKKQVYDAIHEIQKKIPYDQLLLEYSGASTVWVHVSFVYKGLRKQSFTMKNHARCSPFGKYVLV